MDGGYRSLPYESSSDEAFMENMDEYIGSKLTMDTKQGPALVKIIHRKRDPMGKLVRKPNTIPAVDTLIYNVK